MSYQSIPLLFAAILIGSLSGLLLFIQMLVHRVFSAPIVKSLGLKLVWNILAVILVILNLSLLFLALTLMRTGNVNAALFMPFYAVAALGVAWFTIRFTKQKSIMQRKLEEIVAHL